MTGYPEWAYERDDNDALILNHYGQPIVSPGHFMEAHEAIVPTGAGSPPVCTCGWTRHNGHELAEHLADMNPPQTFNVYARDLSDDVTQIAVDVDADTAANVQAVAKATPFCAAAWRVPADNDQTVVSLGAM